MSSLLYPTLPGLGFDVMRRLDWNTAAQTALSGKRSVIALRQYPLVHFELVYNLLRDDQAPSDLQALAGLYNQMLGRYDHFLFTDPDFNSVVAEQFGVSTGSTATQYQLVANYGNPAGPGVNEMVQNLNGTPQLFDNGVPINPATYTISAVGVVSFSGSPALGHVLTWTGQFYYRCAFDDDSFEMTKFMNQWWKATVKFTSVIL